MTPIEDFEHQLLLTNFGLTCGSLRLLAKAGLMDDPERDIIHAHLGVLHSKLEAVEDLQIQALAQQYLDLLTAALPPTTSRGSSPTSE